MPWVPRTVSPKAGWLDSLCLSMFDKFARAAIRTGHLRIVLPTGAELSYGDPANVEPAQPESECPNPRP